MAESYSETLLGAIEREMRLVVLELEAAAGEELDRAGRNDTAETKNSLYSSVERDGSALVGTVGASSDHAIFVHEGRGPGKPPPISAIRPWVLRKLSVPEPEADRTAFLIARKIGARGTEGTPFLTRPFEIIRPELAGRFAAAGADALNTREPSRRTA